MKHIQKNIVEAEVVEMPRIITQKERTDRMRKSRGYREFREFAEFLATDPRPSDAEVLRRVLLLMDRFQAFKYRWIAYATSRQLDLIEQDLRKEGIWK
jgi:hypothetical protein